MSVSILSRRTLAHPGIFKGLLPALTALAVGAWMYIALRPGSPVFAGWLREWGLGNGLSAIRRETLPWASRVPDILLYSLTTGLWAFGYTLLMAVIWQTSSRPAYRRWAYSGLLLAPAWEALEWSGVVSGTACLNDIAMGMAGAGVALLFVPHQKIILS